MEFSWALLNINNSLLLNLEATEVGQVESPGGASGLAFQERDQNAKHSLVLVKRKVLHLGKRQVKKQQQRGAMRMSCEEARGNYV